MGDTDPIMDAAPSVTIAGHEYELRRLGLRDVFRVSRIIGRGVSVLANTTEFTVGQVVQVLVSSMTANEEEVLTLIADVLGIKRDDLNDPERFPMDSIVDVLEALGRHQDLMGFFKRVQAMAERLPGTPTP